MLDNWLGGDVDWVTLAVGIAVAGMLASVVADGAARLARKVLVGIAGGDAAGRAESPIVRRPIRITRVAVFVAVLCALMVPAFELAGARISVGLGIAALTGWLLRSGLRIFMIALLTYLLVRIVAAVAHRLEDQISHEAVADEIERTKRARTLSRLVQNGLTTIVLVAAVLTVLRELQVDIMPVLAGAGIIGLAVGFGAQTLVKDFISGFFLILENQIRIGDVATINGTGGLVEAINLRTIVLRDVEGAVHVFPNGAIETLANRTKDFSYFVVDLGVASKEDPDHAMAVLREVGEELVTDPRYKLSVLEPIEILGVDAFDESQVTIRARIKTVPQRQWEVGRELRRRIKKTFDVRGIEIRFPHVSVYFDAASRSFALRGAS